MARKPFSLVAVHGNGGGAFRFARTVPFVPEWVDFRPITLPGFAAIPADPTLLSVSDYAKRLGEMIADVPRPVILLGTGIGGTIALQLAQQPDTPIDGLILHAPVGTRLDSRRFPRLMRVPGMKSLVKGIIASRLTRPIMARRLFHSPLPQAYIDQFFDEYAQCSVFAQMFEIITPEWFAQLRPSPVPTALLWGAKERILSVDQLDDYKRLLPNHLVRIVENWDHFPMVEQPAEFAVEVVRLSEQLLE